MVDGCEGGGERASCAISTSQLTTMPHKGRRRRSSMPIVWHSCGAPTTASKSSVKLTEPATRREEGAVSRHTLVDAAKAHRDEFPSGSAARDEADEVVNLVMEQYAGEVRDNKCLNVLQCAMTSYDQGRKGACCPSDTGASGSRLSVRKGPRQRTSQLQAWRSALRLRRGQRPHLHSRPHRRVPATTWPPRTLPSR